MDRKIKAYDYFREGYNCAQSVMLAFADVLPLDVQTLKNISAGFGGGFARTRNLCGAVSASGMIIGLLESYTGDVSNDKKDVYKNVREGIVDKFTEMNGTIICGELLKGLKDITDDYIPAERNSEYYKTRPCVKFVMDAVGIIEDSDLFKEYIAKKNFE